MRQPILKLPPIIRLIGAAIILTHLCKLFFLNWQNVSIARFGGFTPFSWEIPKLFNIEVMLTSITYSYLHANAYHLLINFFFLISFGTAIARRMSAAAFLILYTTSGMFSAYFWMVFNWGENTSLIGASGSLSGILGVLVRISVTPKYAFDFPQPIMPPSTAKSFGLLWVGTNLMLWFFETVLPREFGYIAWQAHVGGFIFGFLICGVFDDWGFLKKSSLRDNIDEY